MPLEGKIIMLAILIALLALLWFSLDLGSNEDDWQERREKR